MNTPTKSTTESSLVEDVVENTEEKFDQARIRIEEIEKVNKKLQNKLKLASKEQVKKKKKI